MYRVAVVMLCGMVSIAARAEDPFKFDVETTLMYARINGAATIFQIDVQRYFNTVNTQSRPRAEAAFLQHASSVNVAVYNMSIDGENYQGNELGANGAIRYVVDGYPFVVSAKVGGAAQEIAHSDANLNTSMYGVGAGAYITQGTYLGGEYSKANQTLSSSAYYVNEKKSSTDVGIHVKSVFEISDTLAAAVTASRTQTRFAHNADADFSTLDFGLDVYVNRETSVGIQTEDEQRSGGGDLRVRTIVLRWFFVPQVSVKLEFGQLMERDPALNSIRRHQVVGLSLSGDM